MFVTKPTLSGRRVDLRPVTRSDAEPLRALMGEREVMRLTGMLSGSDDPGPQLDAAAAREWYGSRSLEPERLDLAVVERATGQVRGEIALTDWDPRARSASLRTFLGAAGQNRGLGTEAIALVLGHAFGLGVHRVALEVYAFNPRARHVYEKVGFVHEGTRREALAFDGGWIDAELYAILDREWAGSCHPDQPS